MMRLLKLLAGWVCVWGMLVGCRHSPVTMAPAPAEVYVDSPPPPTPYAQIARRTDCPLETAERSWGIYTLDLENREIRRLTEEGENYRYPAFSPGAGRWLAFVRVCTDRGALVLYDVATGAVRVLFEGEGWYGPPTWSPAGEVLAVTVFRDGMTSIMLYRPGSGSMESLVSWHGLVHFLSWSPDGRELAFSGQVDASAEIYKVAVEEGEVVQLTRTGGWGMAPAWSPRLTRLAFIEAAADSQDFYDGQLRIIDPTVPQRAAEAFTQPVYVRPVWSPDGKWITTGGGSAGTALFRPDDLTESPLIEGKDGVFTPAGWSPDGRRLLVERYNCCERTLMIVDRESREVQMLLDRKREGVLFWQAEPVWAPSGEQIAFSGLLDPPAP